MVCMTKECLCDYMHRLEDGIAEYMSMPISQRSADAITGMIEAWEHAKAMKDLISYQSATEFTREVAREWCDKMQNADGTMGCHWTIADTESVGRPSGVEDYVWNAVMNAMYSDYSEVAYKFGVNSAEFFKDMAMAFLYDRDAVEPMQKVSEYYQHIVKK